MRVVIAALFAFVAVAVAPTATSDHTDCAIHFDAPACVYVESTPQESPCAGVAPFHKGVDGDRQPWIGVSVENCPLDVTESVSG